MKKCHHDQLNHILKHQIKRRRTVRLWLAIGWLGLLAASWIEHKVHRTNWSPIVTSTPQEAEGEG